MSTLLVAFSLLPMEHLVIPAVWMARWRSYVIVSCPYCIHYILDVKAVGHSLPSISVSVSRLPKVPIGTINGIEVSDLLDNPSTAVLVSKTSLDMRLTFFNYALSFQVQYHLHNNGSKAWSDAPLRVGGQRPQIAVQQFWIIVAYSVVANSVIAGLTSRLISPSLFIFQCSVCRFSYSSGSFPLPAADPFHYNFLISPFVLAFQSSISRSSWLTFLTISSNGSWEASTASSELIIGGAMSSCERVEQVSCVLKVCRFQMAHFLIANMPEGQPSRLQARYESTVCWEYSSFVRAKDV